MIRLSSSLSIFLVGFSYCINAVSSLIISKTDPLNLHPAARTLGYRYFGFSASLYGILSLIMGLRCSANNFLIFQTAKAKKKYRQYVSHVQIKTIFPTRLEPVLKGKSTRKIKIYKETIVWEELI